MKKLILLIIVCVITVCFIACGKPASENKPAVARVASYLEGIVDMKVTLGQSVKKGQLLFQIKTDYTQIVKSKCENGVWFFKKEYNRIHKLGITHSQSVENVQEAKYNLDNAIGTLKIEDLLLYKWSKYYAPFDGVVTNIYCYNGSASPSDSGNIDNNNAVLEVIKLEDFNKGKVKIGPAIAQVYPMIEGIVELKVEQGEKVKKGQLLFKISTEYNEITKAQQMAQVINNRARYERSKNLYAQNTTIPLKDYQTAEYNLKNSIQDLKGTELIINKRSSYYAPFDGVVSNILHYSGSNVFAGHKVLEVTKL